MATRPIVPRANGEGSLGVSTKSWGGVFTNELNGANAVDMADFSKATLRRPSTAYAVGAMAYHATRPAGWYLECTTAGTTGSGTLTITSPTVGGTVSDGTVTWTIRQVANTVYETTVIADNAAAHNGIYRGKDITAYYESGEMSAAIADGSFKGIYIGDYITKSITLPAITYTNKSGTEVTQAAQTFNNVKWLVAGCDVHLHCGDSETTTHHVLLIPSSTLQRNVSMNPTNDTAGGYLGSDMWRVHIPNWANAITNAFGSSHVLSHRELLSNAVDTSVQSTYGGGTGKASNWAWTSVLANIPNEAMVYGSSVFGSSFDVGDFNHVLPLYALKANHLNDRSWFWLRAVASSSQFAVAASNGLAIYFGASFADSDGGIRPYFLYH